MRKPSLSPTGLCFLLALLCLLLSPAQAPAESQPCKQYGDSFVQLRSDRWYTALNFSQSRGQVNTKDEKLVLTCSESEGCEIQVYSLFLFEGDFDIQTSYEILTSDPQGNCRFNAGLVMETEAGDELSYKNYITRVPGGRILYRARLDRLGIANVERKKVKLAAGETGKLRIVRKKGILTYMAWREGKWTVIHTYEKPCEKKLRVRFKITTGSQQPMQDACPVSIGFDDFTVNSCQRIIDG